MIVKNEEKVLERVLKCAARICDELIVVDTGSTDKTVEIARKYSEKVRFFEWIDDFSAARNYSFSQAVMDYILWLDADDVLTEENIGKFASLKESLQPATDIVMMKYETAFDGAGRPTFSYYRERLLRRAHGFVWQDPVHEVIVPAGKIVYSDIAVQHRKTGGGLPGRNLAIYEKMIRSGRTLSPRQRFYYARELMYADEKQNAIREFRAFLQLKDAWVENKISACLDLSKCLLEAGDREDALAALLQSFIYDAPRAEILCAIGKFLTNEGKYKQAAYWYRSALSCDKSANRQNFTSPDCYDFIPYLQLCVCHDRMGDRVGAELWNRKAGKIKPKDPAYLYNVKYFKGLKQK